MTLKKCNKNLNALQKYNNLSKLSHIINFSLEVEMCSKQLRISLYYNIYESAILKYKKIQKNVNVLD